MANAHESLGEHVKDKPSDELDCLEGQGSASTTVRVVSPREGHLAARHVEQSVIRYRYAVRVAGQVLQHAVWTSERRLGVDHPLLRVQRRQVGSEVRWVFEVGKAAVEFQTSSIERSLDLIEELAPEHSGKYPNREEEPRLARDPSGAVQ